MARKGKKGAKSAEGEPEKTSPETVEPADQGAQSGSVATEETPQPKVPEPQPGPSSAPDVASATSEQPETESETASTASKKKRKKKKKGAAATEGTEEAAQPSAPASSVPGKAAEKGAGDAVSEDLAKLSLSGGLKCMYAIPRKVVKKAHDSSTCSHFPKIEVNYLQLTFKRLDIQLYHYDVTFIPEKPKALLRPAIEKFFREHCKGRYPAFDGVKNVYAAKTKLPFKTDLERNTVEVADPEDNGRMKSFDITVKLTPQSITFKQLMKYMEQGRSQDIPQDVIQATDIALRNGLYKSFIPCGRSFFSGPMPQTVELTGGMELYDGFFQSAIMGQGKAFLNVDVSNKAFPIQQTVLEFLKNDLKVYDCSYDLEPRVRANLQDFLRGLKVNYELKGEKRTYRVNGLGQSARDYRFKPAEKNEMSVEQYFKTVKGVTLSFPKLPLLHVGPPQKNTMIPMEYCKIIGGQTVMRKLDDKQTAAMVKAAARPTAERKARILKSIQSAQYHKSEVLTNEFDISVNTKFHQVQSYVFKPPKIRYNPQETAITPLNGEWKMDRQRFAAPGPIDMKAKKALPLKWAVLIKDGKIKRYELTGPNGLVELLPRCANQLGMNMAAPCEVVESGDPRRQNEREIERELTELGQKYGLNIVVVILPGGGPGSKEAYGNVKRASEFRCGVLTQCLKSLTVTKKMNSTTANNLLLKMNAKVNGINHYMDPESKPKRVFDAPVMFVGADVTHPAPGSEGSPSIAAVAASFDVNAFKYRPEYRLQGSRQEMIVDLADMMEKQLEYFKTRISRYPKRILYYRDGVSEGQFNTVLDMELTALKKVCTKLGIDAQITFLVVQKRHHTRFFPSFENSDKSKNMNVLAGTVVDTDITHPTETDFYLVSHKSIQGTARPTKYHLLYDENNFDCEELEILTYYLCYMFARCNRAVSYPAPTYYAHLAAFRARAWWEGQRPNLGNLSKDQSERGTIHKNMESDNPMFFV